VNEEINHLVTELLLGEINRRQFLRRALAIGFSMPAAATLLAACGQQPPRPAPAAPTSASATAPAPAIANPTAVPTSAAAGTVQIGSSAEFNLMDPLTNTFLNDLNLLYVNLYDQLIIRNKDGSFGPGLAQSWSLHSPTEWDFKLQQGVKFHNGEPFNAEAMKFNMERFKADDAWGPVKNAIKSTEVIDEYTIRMTTTTPKPILLEEALYYVFPVPPEYATKVGNKGLTDHPMGTGPFKFVEWVKGDHLALEQYPDYWRGKPHIQNVVFKIVPEIATRVAALRAGELDLILQLTPDEIPTLEADPNFRVVSTPVARIFYLITFPDSPVGTGAPLKDTRVRQALNYAINIDAIIENILSGQAVRSGSLAPPLAFGYDPSVTPYPYDPDKAKQLLADAGFPDGFNLDMDVPTGGNPLKPVEVGQAIAADLGKVGIKVNLRTIEAASYITYRNEKKMAPLFLWEWFGYDAHKQLWGAMSPDFKFAYWIDPKISDFLNTEATSMDPKARQAAFSEIEQIMKAESWFIPLYQQNEIYGVNNRLVWERNFGGHVWLWDASLKA